MMEEATQVANTFFTETISEWGAKGSSLLAESLNWLSANQTYLLCVAGGIVVGMLYAKMKKKS